MADIARGVLAGAWSLLVGWILPVFIVLQVANLLLTPALDLSLLDQYRAASASDRQLTLVFLAAVLGIVLNAVQTPMYKVLEGYWLWPGPIKRKRKERHAELREEEMGKAEKNPALWGSIRYPSPPIDVLPTALGNAIRRFETYSADRYKLDSIRLFHHLAASAPAYIQQAYERARTNVDFAVCLLWTSSVAGLGSLAAWPWFTESRLHAFAIVAAVAAVLAYRLAVVSTDEWGATMRAMVDMGRKGAAEVFGLKVPTDLNDEREMWSYVNLFARGPYATTGTATEWITYFRSGKDAQPSDGSAEAAAARILAVIPEVLDRCRPSAADLKLLDGSLSRGSARRSWSRRRGGSGRSSRR